MARWIKADGTEQIVHPENGVEFTNAEMHKYIPGFLSAIILDPTTYTMYIDDQYLTKGLPFNEAATNIAHSYKPTLRAQNWPVCGDVLICTLSETGDD